MLSRSALLIRSLGCYCSLCVCFGGSSSLPQSSSSITISDVDAIDDDYHRDWQESSFLCISTDTGRDPGPPGIPGTGPPGPPGGGPTGPP